MANETRKINLEFTTNTRGLKEAQKATSDFSRSWTEFQSKLQLTTQAYNAFSNAIEQGGAFSNLQRGFESLKESTGAYQVSLEGLQKASYGLVDSVTLLTQANTAMTLGLPGDELESTIEQVTRLARAQGVEATHAIESFITGTARQSKMMLDNLGILVSVEQANEAYATSIGKTVKQLTDQERRTAFTTAAMQALKEKSEQVNEINLNAADQFKRLEISAQDAFLQFTKGIAESSALAHEMGLLNEATGEVDWQQLGKDVGNVAASFVSLGKPIVEAAGFIDDLKVSIDNFLSKAAGPFVNVITKMAKYVPLAGEGIEGLGKAIQQANYDKANRELEDFYETTLGLVTSTGDYIGVAPKAKEEIEDTGEEARKAAEKIAELREEFFQLGQKGKLDGIKNNLEDAISNLDESAFDDLLRDFEDAFKRLKTDELSKKYGEAVSEAQIAERVSEELGVAVDEFEDKFEEGVSKSFEEVYRDTTNIWGDLLAGVVRGDLKETIENMLIDAAIQWGAEMLAQWTLVALGMQSASAVNYGLGGYGNLIGGLFGGGSSNIGPVASGSDYASSLSGGAGLGAYAGYAGIAAGAGLALYGQYNSIQGIRKDGTTNTQAARFASSSIDPYAAMLYGIEDMLGGNYVSQLDPLANFSRWAGLDLTFGGNSQASMQRRRRQGYISSLQDRGVLQDGGFDLFGGGRGFLEATGANENYNIDFENTDNRSVALGNLLSVASIGGLDEQLVGMFTNALSEAETFNGQLLTTRELLGDLGFSVEDMGNQIVQAFLDGTLSIEEMNAALQGLELIKTEDLEDIAAGFQLIADTADGETRHQIKALELTMQEFKQAGVESNQELVNNFRHEFGNEAANIIQNFVNSGIDLFTDFSNLSYEQIAFIINNIGTLSQIVRDDLANSFGDAKRASDDFYDSEGRKIDETSRKYRELNGLVDKNTDAKQRNTRTGSAPGGSGYGVNQTAA